MVFFKRFYCKKNFLSFFLSFFSAVFWIWYLAGPFSSLIPLLWFPIEILLLLLEQLKGFDEVVEQSPPLFRLIYVRRMTSISDGEVLLILHVAQVVERRQAETLVFFTVNNHGRSLRERKLKSEMLLKCVHVYLISLQVCGHNKYIQVDIYLYWCRKI